MYVCTYMFEFIKPLICHMLLLLYDITCTAHNRKVLLHTKDKAAAVCDGSTVMFMVMEDVTTTTTAPTNSNAHNDTQIPEERLTRAFTKVFASAAKVWIISLSNV